MDNLFCGSKVNILNYLNSKPKSREMLCYQTGLDDRVVRKLISQAREDGALICNDQSGLGYYLITEVEDHIEELKDQYNQDHSRAMKILKRMKYTRHALQSAGIVIKW